MVLISTKPEVTEKLNYFGAIIISIFVISKINLL
jgi:hypothetical protein